METVEDFKRRTVNEMETELCCVVLYILIYITPLTARTNQRRYQCGRQGKENSLKTTKIDIYHCHLAHQLMRRSVSKE